MGSLRGLLPLCPVAFLKRFLEYAQGLFYYHVYLTGIWYHICPAMVLYLALCRCYTHPTHLGIISLLSPSLHCWSDRARPRLYSPVGGIPEREYICYREYRLPNHLFTICAVLASRPIQTDPSTVTLFYIIDEIGYQFGVNFV